MDEAYNGTLPYDEVVSLLLRLQTYDKLQISFDCKIDYSQIDKGLDKQIESIKAGTFNENIGYNHVASNDIKSASENIRGILKKIEYITESIYAWGLRRKLIDYFKAPSEFIYKLDIPCLEEFDEEMLDVFWETYKKLDNKYKIESFEYLLKINYCFPYRTSIDKSQCKLVLQRTINNFKELKNKLVAQSMQESDKITKLLEAKHIYEIEDFIMSLKTELQKLTN